MPRVVLLSFIYITTSIVSEFSKSISLIKKKSIIYSIFAVVTLESTVREKQ